MLIHLFGNGEEIHEEIPLECFFSLTLPSSSSSKRIVLTDDDEKAEVGIKRDIHLRRNESHHLDEKKQPAC